MIRAPLFSITLVALLSATASASGSPPVEARGTQAAARCLEHFARGETPPAPAPAMSKTLEAVMAVTGGSGPGEGVREGLRRCLARAMPFPSRLTPEQARWLAPCLQGAALALRGARQPAQRARARFQVAACRAVGDAMSRWDPDASGLGVGRPRAHPEVYVGSIGPVEDLTLGERRIADALDAAAGSLAACRATHGNGKVRAVAQSGAHWKVYAWPVEGPDALARCVEDAVRGAALPKGPAETIAVDISLTDPRPAAGPPGGLSGTH